MSLLRLVLLLFNQFIINIKAVNDPLSYNANKSKSRTRTTIALIWVISILLSSIHLFIYSCHFKDQTGVCYCQEIWNYDRSVNSIYYTFYTAWIFLQTYFLPACVIIFTYQRIIVKIKNRNHPLRMRADSKSLYFAKRRQSKNVISPN